jgi:asparagine synthase (glutamine-hydrolysing)
MSVALSHRGPDGEGLYIDAGAGLVLAHRRLAIVDLSDAGSQPMQSADGRYTIVFNGEIYNFSRLREQIESESPGYVWRGHSDTEVLLELISKRGYRRALEAIEGMFAFALWDAQRKTLVLARDRFGEKPLYYGFVDGALLFASELSAIRMARGWTGALDETAIRAFLQYGYVPGELAAFYGFKKLKSGTLIEFVSRRGGPMAASAPVPYWTLEKSIRETPVLDVRDEVALVDRVDAELRRAVSERMVADVPLGAFLSGGIDSSLVVSMMQAVSSQRVRTFCVGFATAGLNEAPHAAAIAKHLGTDHTEVVMSERDARDIVLSVAQLWDEPFADASQLATLLVSRVARRSVTVALSGDGGDELFSGYSRYAVLERLARLPPAIRQLAGYALSSLRFGKPGGLIERAGKLGAILSAKCDAAMYERWMSVWPLQSAAGFRDACLQSPRRSLREQMMYADTLTYLPDDILVKVDRSSMSTGLETRVPLLDRGVFELAWSIPNSLKYRDGRGKWILRRVLARYLPRPLFDRPKAGFEVPLAAWLRGPLRDWADSHVTAYVRDPVGGLDPETVSLMWQQHVTGARNWHYRLWTVVMFQAWRHGLASLPVRL